MHTVVKKREFWMIKSINCIKMSHLNLNNHNFVQRCPKGYMLKNIITIGVTF